MCEEVLFLSLRCCSSSAAALLSHLLTLAALERHLHLLEDTKWAKTLKRKDGERVAVEPRCFDCALIAAKAFSECSWEALVAKSAMEAETKSQIETARAQLVKQRNLPVGFSPTPFTVEEFSENLDLEVAFTQPYLFVSDQQFRREHGMSAADAGLATTSLRNEVGEMVTGLLVKEDSSVYPRVNRTPLSEGQGW